MLLIFPKRKGLGNHKLYSDYEAQHKVFMLQVDQESLRVSSKITEINGL